LCSYFVLLLFVGVLLLLFVLFHFFPLSSIFSYFWICLFKHSFAVLLEGKCFYFSWANT
jgi:hypothetical protein